MVKAALHTEHKQRIERTIPNVAESKSLDSRRWNLKDEFSSVTECSIGICLFLFEQAKSNLLRICSLHTGIRAIGLYRSQCKLWMYIFNAAGESQTNGYLSNLSSDYLTHGSWTPLTKSYFSFYEKFNVLKSLQTAVIESILLEWIIPPNVYGLSSLQFGLM